MDLKQGDLENIVLNALWDLEGEGAKKIYVGDVKERIKSPNKKWAYTTVKTVLDRLVDKELSFREKDGKRYVYNSVVQRSEAGLRAIQKVMRQYFKNDAMALYRCVQQLRPSDNGTDVLPSGERPMSSDASTQSLPGSPGKELVHQ